MAENMNILLCINNNYLDKAKTMLFSLRKHINDELLIQVFIMSSDINIENNNIKYIENELKIKVYIINFDIKIFNKFNICNYNYTIDMYYRLFCQFYLPSSVHRILYLDADMIILKDLYDLYNIEFKNKSIVVCEDVNINTFFLKKHIHNLKLYKRYKYFNSGMMLMNIDKIRIKFTIDDILKTCFLLQKKIKYPDQDILNYLYHNDILYVSNVYNYQITEKTIYKFNINNIYIIHYITSMKPWNFRCQNKISKYYWNNRIKQGYIYEYIIIKFLSVIYKIYKFIKNFK